MRKTLIVLSAAVILVAGGAVAQTFLSWRGPNNEEFTGFVLGCPTGVGRAAVPCGTDANPLPVKAPTGGFATTPSGVTRTRLTCTLPAYATGGNIVCTDQAGAQTTTACAANTACLVSGANSNRKTVLATVRTAGVTCDVGYSATVAPGNSIGIDGSATAGGQGGSLNEAPAHVQSYYAACPAAATLVFVQGQ